MFQHNTSLYFVDAISHTTYKKYLTQQDVINFIYLSLILYNLINLF